ncbi:hypothetical protein GPECTOR_49g499 [Gonium pectorale]|uniref:Uncharacterized protein n=1 Tax=Gonium pectorale TaxID=33097 RepID=A0A150G8M9_GONPE|nr:hypothetical protein GPECTOR_49g499 [Gonium pectorale]|eukprot:KXZ45915.1 hypothetical protein GPECTOR_49g499 [Gonium pectorale]
MVLAQQLPVYCVNRSRETRRVVVETYRPPVEEQQALAGHYVTAEVTNALYRASGKAGLAMGWSWGCCLRRPLLTPIWRKKKAEKAEKAEAEKAMKGQTRLPFKKQKQA